MPEEQVEMQEELTLGKLTQGLAAAVEDWRTLETRIEEVRDRVNYYRGQLSAQGMSINVEGFDAPTRSIGQASTQLMVPGVPNYAALEEDRRQEAEADRAQQSAQELLDAELEEGEIDIDAIPATTEVDVRSVSQIQNDAMESQRAVTEQEQQAFQATIGASLQRALEAGYAPAFRMATPSNPFAAGEARTRGFTT